MRRKLNVAKNESENVPFAASIDLHGYRKSEGVRALTSFLDEVSRKHESKAEVWVLVITGSGAHSPEGPVLRTAIEGLLEKRKMRYFLNHGKGSFRVQANSGFCFYEPGAPIDTKLILKCEPIEHIPTLPNSDRGRRGAVVPGGMRSDDPTPSQVAATDKAFEESKVEHQRFQNEQKKEEKLLRRVLSMSVLEAEKEEKEEQEALQRALSLSQMDCYRIKDEDADDDEDFQEALKASMHEQIQIDNDDDDELQRVLEISRKVASQADDDLMRAVELSKLDI